jgi:hypothetical protein
MPELERAPDVAGVKDILDRDAVGPVPRQERTEAGVNVLQLIGEKAAGGRRKRAADDEVMTAADGFHAAVSGTF